MPGLLALGAVFLAVTGAEALYADLGHFGRGPIRAAWLYLVFPALALNYLGQGALLLGSSAGDRESILQALSRMGTAADGRPRDTGDDHRQSGRDHRRLFDHTAGNPTRPLAAYATSAGHRQTESGQIYIPAVNWYLLLAVLFLTAAFKNSSALASAYGIAVTGTMVVTVVLATIVARYYWQVAAVARWPGHGAVHGRRSSSSSAPIC